MSLPVIPILHKRATDAIQKSLATSGFLNYELRRRKPLLTQRYREPVGYYELQIAMMVKRGQTAYTPKLSTALEATSWLEFSPTLSNISGLIAGVDEVGRGALFGPVVAAAVILPVSAFSQLITAEIKDSKKLSHSRRVQLAQQICTVAIDWRIGYAATAEIDKINILQATILAMKRAISKLKVQPAMCLVDGNQPVKDLLMPQQIIIKGDERSLNIAAASIVAKVWRDDLIQRLAAKYPMYDLNSNKGYGSKKHLLALQKYGASPLHRQSFRPCQIQLMAENREQ